MTRSERRTSTGLLRLANYLWLPITILAVWALSSGNGSSFYLPDFRATLDATGGFLSAEGLATDVWPTVSTMFAGFLIAVGAGVVLGVVIGRVAILRELFTPFISFFRSVPPPALLPLAIVVMGIGSEMKVSLIAFGALWPCLLSTIDAVRNQDPALSDLARVYSIGRVRALLRITLPAAAPQIVAGMRTSLLYALTLIVLSEMVATSAGLGHSVLLAQRTFQISDMWAAIIMLGLLGLVLNGLFVVIERRVLRWHLTRHKDGTRTWIT
jgi:sulfonate transport system permease protein